MITSGNERYHGMALALENSQTSVIQGSVGRGSYKVEVTDIFVVVICHSLLRSSETQSLPKRTRGAGRRGGKCLWLRGTEWLFLKDAGIRLLRLLVVADCHCRRVIILHCERYWQHREITRNYSRD